MTVCAAALFSWIYNAEKKDFGLAIVAFSDRMLTDEGLGIQYQGGKWKAALLNTGRMILVSGPFVVHSELMRRLFETFKEPAPGAVPPAQPTTHELAQLYAKLMRDYKREQASHLYLAPLTLDENDRFISQQRLLDPALVADLANQLQNHKIDGNPEALVIGCEGTTAHLYRVNSEGLVTCHDDIGFVSIGNGGIHASGHFMLEEHNQTAWYYKALFTAFSAKKRAEVAPGVGEDKTDMFLITRNGVDRLPDELVKEMQRIYDKHRKATKKAEEQDVTKLMEFDAKTHRQQSPPPVTDPAKSPDPSSST